MTAFERMLVSAQCTQCAVTEQKAQEKIKAQTDGRQDTMERFRCGGRDARGAHAPYGRPVASSADSVMPSGPPSGASNRHSWEEASSVGAVPGWNAYGGTRATLEQQCRVARNQ